MSLSFDFALSTKPAHAEETPAPAAPLHMGDDLVTRATRAAEAAQALVATAKARLAPQVMAEGRVSGRLLEAAQFAAHGLAWYATYAEALREMAGWAGRLAAESAFGETERLILAIGCGEYLAQMAGGIPMSQGETVRPADIGLGPDDIAAFRTADVENLIAGGNTDAARLRLVALMREQAGAATFGHCGLDEEFEMIRDQFRRFADEKVVPHAHGWHLRDELIPMEIIAEMSELGVFGLTIPEEHGGFGMGKTAMCVVSEELSRGYIGVGSLGTRSEIAAELILAGGTDARRPHGCPASRAARCSRRRSSPSPTPAPTSGPCAPAPPARARTT